MMKDMFQEDGYRFQEDAERFLDEVSGDNGTRTAEDLTALVIGQAFLAHMREVGVMKDILTAVDGQALRILEEIQRTLDDDTLDDPACFERIEKILAVLETNGLGSTRHDF